VRGAELVINNPPLLPLSPSSPPQYALIA